MKSNFFFGRKETAPDYVDETAGGESLAKTEWSDDSCTPLTVEEYLEPQLHPDKHFRSIVRQTRSFAELLAPRVELKDGKIALQDLNSVGRIFDVQCSSTEARTVEAIQATADKITHAVSQVFPQYAVNPWIVQYFVQDESGEIFRSSLEGIREYANERASISAYSENWFRALDRHFQDLSRQSGMFSDPYSGGERWRGRRRRTRICVWRIIPQKKIPASDDIDRMCEQMSIAFAQAGIRLVPAGAKELYEWLTHWFVPDPAMQSGCETTLELLKKHPWCPHDLNRAMAMFSDTAQHDIGRASLHGVAPWTWKKPGIWWFRKRPSRFITLDEISREPEVGHLTAERQFGDGTGTLLDKLPAGSIWSMTVVYSPQDAIRDRIMLVRKNSVGDDAAAVERRELANVALREIVKGNHVFRVYSGVYVFGKDLAELDSKSEKAISMMSTNGLRPVLPRYDPVALDSYVRALPFGFDPIQDSKPYTQRAKLWYSSHIARMVPVYGRSTGTGVPGCLLFNRGAELLTFDPLNPLDRAKNAHSLVLGPTGSGKTAFLIYYLMHAIAIHRPRIFLITALPTFGLLSDHCENHELRVHRVRIDGKSDISLPPFKHAQLLLDEQESQKPPASDSDDEDDLSTQIRDPLGEMEIQARLMITGGEVSEEQNLRRDDRDMIRTAIIEAAKQSRSENRSQTLTQDVVNVLRSCSRDQQLGEQPISAEQARRAARLAGAMHLFCTGLNGRLFNREGDPWPDADVTLVELDLLARRGYEDRLAIALTGLFSLINSKIESEQYQERQTIVVIDEAHLLLQNSLVSPYINRISAMWRTFGAWLWIATQNIRQFPEQAKELLNQPEWWFCLSVENDEIEQISRFKSLTPEQRNLMQAAKKLPGKYTEGAILSAKLLALFRNVPPALALALSQTEKSEKAERARIMDELQCSELEAAYHIAELIRASRIADLE